MPEPTEAARALRLGAIRRRADNDRRDDTSMPVLDRRWLLGEVDRLHTERDNATQRLAALLADYDRDTTP